jgi:hypothetical protein
VLAVMASNCCCRVVTVLAEKVTGTVYRYALGESE